MLCSAISFEFRGLIPLGEGLTIKEIAMETIRQIPEDATWEDIHEGSGSVNPYILSMHQEILLQNNQTRYLPTP